MISDVGAGVHLDRQPVLQFGDPVDQRQDPIGRSLRLGQPRELRVGAQEPAERAGPRFDQVQAVLDLLRRAACPARATSSA